MLTISKPHIQTTIDTISFRIYLRNRFYRVNIGRLVDILYQNFSTSDVQVYDNLQIAIKIRSRKSTMDTLEFCTDINFTLVELFKSCNLMDLIMTDTTITEEQRNIFMNTYKSLIDNSSYMSYMYSSVLIDRTILCIDL